MAKEVIGLNQLPQLLEDLNSIRFKTKVPAFRSFDISKDVDLIEEVLRIYGYTNVEPLRPELPVEGGLPKDLLKELRSFLTARGFNEVITFPWLEEDIKEVFNLESYWEVVNPLSSEQKNLRTSLVPSLIKVAKFNQNNFNYDLALFEFGRVYLPDKEENRLCLLAVGNFRKHFQKTESWNFLTFKGIVESLLTKLGISAKVKPLKVSYMHPYLCGEIIAENQSLGIFGKLHPKIAEKLELKNTPFVAELNLDLLRELYKKPLYRGISKFPPVKRDFAFVFDKETLKSEGILETAKEVFGELLEEAFVFDVYEGERLAPNEISVAVRIVLRHPERSLSDSEVNQLAQRYIEKLERRGYRLRS